jgi:hypothetical protein
LSSFFFSIGYIVLFMLHFEMVFDIQPALLLL